MKITKVVVRAEIDEEPDLSYLEQECFNEPDSDGENANYGKDRIKAYGHDWCMVGIIAEATIEWEDVWSEDGQTCLAAGGTTSVEQSVWGVESDADSALAQEHGEDLIAELRIALGHEPKFADLADFPDDVVEWEIFRDCIGEIQV
jgi:hypothetical protein